MMRGTKQAAGRIARGSTAQRPGVVSARNVAARFKVGEIPDRVMEVVNKQPAKLYINGKYVDAVSKKTYEDFCPMNGEAFCEVAEGAEEDVDIAVSAARAAFDGPWGALSGMERAKHLNRYADLLEENMEELATLEALDNGKPYSVALSNDLKLVVECFRYFAGCANTITGQTIDTNDGTLCSTVKEPIGVVGAIIPWNFPLMLYAWKVAPAMAAGCTLVIKCSKRTPLTALRAAELATEAGIPAGVINVIPGSGSSVGNAMTKHPKIDKISFTGSTGAGKKVMAIAAETVKNVTLELGGKSPLIVCADCDVDEAATVAFKGIYSNHGQNCCASSRCYVHEDVYDEFMDKLRSKVENIKVGNPFDEDTFQGPQIDSKQFESILGYIEAGKKEATLVIGGERASDTGYYIQPTIFTDVPESATICEEEIFGPVLSVSKFTDLDEVIRRGNETPYGLAAGVCSKNIDNINKLTKALKAGTVWVNTWNAMSASAPFGGYKQSGINRDKGQECLENYLETKCIIMPKPECCR